MSKYPLIVKGSAWSIDYDGAVEPDADSPAWTLTGTDHATSDGSDLTIASCGTDKCMYTLGSLTDGTDLLVAVRAKANSSPAAQSTFHLASARIRPSGGTTGRGFSLTYCNGVLRLIGAATHDVTVSLATARTMLVYLDRANGLISLWVQGLGWQVESVACATWAGPLTDSDAYFGKITVDSDNASLVWSFVKAMYISGRQFYLPPLPRMAWNDANLTAENARNITHSGLIETLHARVDRDFTWENVGLEQDDLDLLRAFYTDVLAPGYECVFVPDATDIEGTATTAKCITDTLKPRQLKQGLPVFSVTMAMRET